MYFIRYSLVEVFLYFGKRCSQVVGNSQKLYISEIFKFYLF